MKKTIIFALIIILLLAGSNLSLAMAEEEEAPNQVFTDILDKDKNEKTGEEIITESAEEKESTESDLPVPAPDPNSFQSIGDIQLDSNGDASLSPEIINKLAELQQPTKSEEELRRERWIRIGIDAAIGVGAALIFLAIFWLIKMNKKSKPENTIEKEL